MNITILEGFLIAGVGGTIAGLTIWLIPILKEKVTERADKKNISVYQRD
jgi:type IV secretory pathway TrbD component